MGSVRRKVEPLESAISICLVIILFLIGVGIFIKQFDVDISRFGMDSAAGGLSSTKLEINKKGKVVLSFAPPDGFGTLLEVEVYSRENLYEKINGKAAFYIESGFEKLFTQRFVSKDNETQWFELFVYDMAAPKNAFSVYSIQKRADVVMFRILDPEYAYRTSNSLYFVNGHYYIELVGSAESGELFRAMVEIRDKIRRKLAVDKVTKIAELSLFPPGDIVSGSAKLYLTNAFGFEGLTDTFTAQYKIDGETITAFISKRPDVQDAQNVVENYYNFLIDNGAVDKTVGFDDFSIDYGKVVDFYGSIEIVFTNGRYVAGIHEAESLTAAEKIAAMLDGKLNEVQKR